MTTASVWSNVMCRTEILNLRWHAFSADFIVYGLITNEDEGELLVR